MSVELAQIWIFTTTFWFVFFCVLTFIFVIVFVFCGILRLVHNAKKRKETGKPVTADAIFCGVSIIVAIYAVMKLIYMFVLLS